MEFGGVQSLNQMLTFYQVFCSFLTEMISKYPESGTMEGSRPSHRTQPPARWVAPAMRADPYKRNTYGDCDFAESYGTGGR